MQKNITRVYGRLDAERESWVAAVNHARVMEYILLGDMYSGELFEVQETGLSNFCMYAAMALQNMSVGGIAECYAGLLDDPEPTMAKLMSLADDALEARVEGEGA